MPSTTNAATAIQVGDPKLRLPDSEKAWPLSFFSLVHRTTSHGGELLSASAGSRAIWELIEPARLCPLKKAGDEDRKLDTLETEAIRDWNRRSKGRKDGVGEFRPGREARDGRTLLLGEETTEPCGHLATLQDGSCAAPTNLD